MHNAFAHVQKVASVLQESQRALSRTNALTFADLVAISGAEALEAIGGPEMAAPLGRTAAGGGWVWRYCGTVVLWSGGLVADSKPDLALVL